MNANPLKTTLLSLLMLFLTFPLLSASSFVGKRTDFRDESIYFVMTTRFYDGDATNNTFCWDGKSKNSGDPQWRGDFKGLIEKLDYIKALGFTAVWITPVVQNASGYDYHGYHAFNMSQVDPRYESEDVSFQTLIDEAHQRGMKIILDIVLNHTGNFGEENLCKMFQRNWEADQSDMKAAMLPITEKDGGPLPDNYYSIDQYRARLNLMKNSDGKNHDSHNYWHHFGHFNWDNETRWWGQIAGDCVDLNTENPQTYNYLIDCYAKFIKMGVDGFRIDTSGHISRLTFNKVFNPAFLAVAEQYKSARNGGPFFMFGEVCTIHTSYWYRGIPALSTPFYTWKESKDYAWDNDGRSWDNLVIMEGDAITHQNPLSCIQQYKDNGENSVASQPISNNVFLDGNQYHQPDYSQYSGLSVIDFPMHHNFRDISGAWNVALEGDKYYNDASFNVVYVDSHDFAPNGAPMDQRFAQGADAWAENLDLMFTFRGIPCLYYGSEIEFKKGCPIDKGPNLALKNSGRAYYGGYIKGEITVNDFADWANASGNINATLNYPLALHIQRLNKIRMAIPALRKGQYSVQECSGRYAFKRRYTDDVTDSYVMVTISGSSTFTGIENGTYVDAITGDTQTVTNGTLTATCNGRGAMRVYVLNTEKTKAPGKIGADGKWLYASNPVQKEQPDYDGTQEELTDGTGEVLPPLEIYEPSLKVGELAAFFEAPGDNSYTNVSVWCWNATTKENYTGSSWPGEKAQLMGKTADGHLIWKWTYQEGMPTNLPTHILFNNTSSPQTVDFIFKNGGYYTVKGLQREIQPQGSVAENLRESSLKVFAHNGKIFIDAHAPCEVQISSIDGVVYTHRLHSGMNVIDDFSRGIYIVDRKKIIL